MQYPQLPAGAFVAAALVLVPLPWHWRARNVATLAIIFWLFAVDVIYGINAIVWSGNVNQYVPIWCDISTKIVVGASFALPIATMCVCKHLEQVSSSRAVRFNYDDKRRRIMFDSFMCFVVPILFMGLHYVVQGHRFDIVENFGCQATVYVSVPAIMIIWFPQLFFALATLIYAVVALHHFIAHRLSFAAHLQGSNSALTPNRYLRLIAMSISQILWGTSLTSLNLWNNVSAGLRPWISWADVHSNFSRVALFAMVGIPQKFLSIMMLLWWAMPVSSFIFFLFFGFGEEAQKEYRQVWIWIKKNVFRQNAKKSSLYTGSLPSSQYRSPLRVSTSNTLNLSSTFDEKKAAFGLRPTSSSCTSLPDTPMTGTLAFPSLKYDKHALPSPSSVESESTAVHRRASDSSEGTYHHISISDAYFSRPPSPSFTVSRDLVMGHPPPAPAPPSSNRRPIPPPSAYSPRKPAPPGRRIIVTVERQAKVDV